jgi:hypothetical protein
MNNQELQNQIDELRRQVEALSSMLTIQDMPYDLKEIIRNEVIKGEDSVTAVTRDITITGTPYDLTLPVNPTGILVFNWRGKEYKIPRL